MKAYSQYEAGKWAYRGGEEYKFSKSQEWQRGWNDEAYKERHGHYPRENEGEEECD